MAALGKARQGLGAAALHPEHSFLLIFTAELPIAAMDTFNNALGTERGTTNNHKGCQEGRTDVFKHMGRDSSHLTNHIKMRCVLILALCSPCRNRVLPEDRLCRPKGVSMTDGLSQREHRQLLD